MTNYINSLIYRVRDNIYYEYEQKHLSFNLANTMQVINTLGDVAYLYIPAQRYDLKLWNEKKVIQYTNKGSYAMANQLYGGFSRTHKNFVDRAIVSAIEQELGDDVSYTIRFIYD